MKNATNKLIKGKRQPQSLKKLLTWANFQDRPDIPETTKCYRSNCEVRIQTRIP